MIILLYIHLSVNITYILWEIWYENKQYRP